MKIVRLFLILLSIAIFSNHLHAQFRVRVNFGEIANLTYQLDCVSGQPLNCSARNFGELWRREFLHTEEDRRMLAEWKNLREVYAQDYNLTDEAGAVYQISVFEKLRIAGFQAQSIADYAERLDLLTAPADRDAFERIVRHFQPRFSNWWQREAAKSGDEFARQTAALLASPKIAEPLKRIYDFYQPVLPADYELAFNLFYTPDFVPEPSNGQQLQNYSVAEFAPREKPEQRIDVIVHELCHFFFENMKPEDGDKLTRRFYNLNRGSAVPAYNLLNESLATAFGNGIIARAVTPAPEFARYLAKEKSFYNNGAIDRAAKANLAWLEEHLKNGKTINDSDFVERYVANLEKTFGAGLVKPKLYLSEMFLFVDGKFGSLRRRVRETLENASMYASEGKWTNENSLDAYKNNPRLNALFIVHPENTSELVKNQIINEMQQTEIAAELKKSSAVLYNSKRASFTYNYIIVAANKDDAGKLLDKLAAADSQFKGIYR